MRNVSKAWLLTASIIFMGAWIWNLPAPLQGIHQVRQADTLFAAWSYCREGAEFLRPRIAHRGVGSGVNIGEFPLASAVFAAPCEMNGAWSEVAVKWVIFAILLLNAGLWGLFFIRRTKGSTGLSWPGWSSFLLLWIFSTHHLLHFTIALPDALALAFIAAALLAFEKSSAASLAAGVALFTLAFGMRPYFIPLLFLTRSRRAWIFTFAACGVFYLWWFKNWIKQSEFLYYATDLTLPWKVDLADWPKIASGLFEVFVRDLPNVVGLAWVYTALRNVPASRPWAWGAVLSSLLVLAVRAPMIVSHHYYLGAAAVFFLLVMIAGFAEMQLRRPGLNAVFSGLYIVIAIANVQHLWHRQALAESQEVTQALAHVNAQPGERIAVYIGEGSASTPYLYWAKATGWAQYASADPGPGRCPDGAVWKMTRVDGQVRVEACALKNPL